MQSVHGISYLEFSYQLLQSWDFWHLYQQHGCRIQLGGNDQWGNIISGVEFIHRRLNAEENQRAGGRSNAGSEQSVMGMTTPLLLTKGGQKFGKSAGNAVWLDPAKTSPFDFYQVFARTLCGNSAHVFPRQYFMKTDDDEVERLLKMFTFVGLEEIAGIMDGHNVFYFMNALSSLLAESLVM